MDIHVSIVYTEHVIFSISPGVFLLMVCKYAQVPILCFNITALYKTPVKLVVPVPEITCLGNNM